MNILAIYMLHCVHTCILHIFLRDMSIFVHFCADIFRAQEHYTYVQTLMLSTHFPLHNTSLHAYSAKPLQFKIYFALATPVPPPFGVSCVNFKHFNISSQTFICRDACDQFYSYWVWHDAAMPNAHTINHGNSW